MASTNMNEEMGQSPEDGAPASGSSAGQSDTEFGHRMEASEEETERYADSEDTDSEGQQSSTSDSGAQNPDGAVGAFAGAIRHS